MENTVFIISKTTGKTAEFAAEELKRYLCLAGISAHCAERAVPEEYLVCFFKTGSAGREST